MKKIGNIKRSVAILVAICAAFAVFTACGGVDKSTSTDTPEVNYNELSSLPELETFDVLPGVPGYTPGEPDEPDEPAERIARYAASSESNKYHRLSCHYVDRIKSYNIVYYYTEDEALDDSKKPCSVCNP